MSGMAESKPNTDSPIEGLDATFRLKNVKMWTEVAAAHIFTRGQKLAKPRVKHMPLSHTSQSDLRPDRPTVAPVSSSPFLLKPSVARLEDCECAIAARNSGRLLTAFSC